MPSTVNGIGTWYWGKKNVLTRPGVCPFCHHSVTLTSYDTRLYFVIFYIPIIPLARKRIIDKCPACTRHRAIDLRKWETAKQLEISGALEKFRANPGPDAAIEAHRQLIAFHQTTEAAGLQKLMAEKYGDNAKVQAYLAGTLTRLGKTAEAAPFFARALQLRPDLPEARIGVAQTFIREKRLDEARSLLDFMGKPGAAQMYSLAPLEQLGNAYQQAGRHKEALELYRRIVQELPDVAQDKGFRKRVQASESATNPAASLLPKAQFNLRRFFSGTQGMGSPTPSFSSRTLLIVLGCAVALAAIGFGVSNEYIRRNRPVQVINELSPNLQLQVDAQSPVKLPIGRTVITLPEGHHRAKFTGAFQDTVDFDLNAAYFTRWFSKPAWVLNPGGAAVVYVERAVYAHNPPPATYDYHFGRDFEKFDDIAYPFTAMPKTLELGSGTSQRVELGLDVFEGPPQNLFYLLEENHRHEQALGFAEWHLSHVPDDKEMLRAYAASPSGTNENPRLEAFLRPGLTNRPVLIEWHRIYQDLLRSGPRSPQLEALYEDMLKAEPTNSGLLYLRGRLIDDHKRAAEYFTRSEQADPKNPYPIHALAFDCIAAAQWPEARALLDRVIQLDPDDAQYRSEWVTASVATGQFAPVEKEFRARLQHDPTDWQSALPLCEVFANQNRRTDAEQLLTGLDRAIRAKHPEAADEIRFMVHAQMLYAFGDFAALEQESRKTVSTMKPAMLFFALIEQNRADEAAKVFTISQAESPLLWLAGSYAFQLAGKTNEARQWREPVVKVLRVGGDDSVRAADLLEGITAPTPEAVDNVVFPASLKAVLLADLALSHPEQREALNAAARKLNIDRSFPYHLIQRATAPAR